MFVEATLTTGCNDRLGKSARLKICIVMITNAVANAVANFIFIVFWGNLEIKTKSYQL